MDHVKESRTTKHLSSRPMSSHHVPGRGWSHRHPFFMLWAITSAVLFGLCAVWSFATPINATDDEGSQIIRAVSVVRGELFGTTLTAASARKFPTQAFPLAVCEAFFLEGGSSKQAATNRCVEVYTVVTVPHRFSNWPFPSNCNTNFEVPDSCPTHLRGADEPAQAITYDGHFPPLYYAIVGLPSLVTQTDAAVYAMRLVSGALTAILVGLSFALAAFWSTRKLLVLGVAVAATPMVFVFGSTINPSALEMSAALCAWTSALLLVLEYSDRPPISLIVACTAASIALVLSRPVSALWLAIIAGFCAALRPAAIRSLLQDRRACIGSGAVAVATVVAVVYVLLDHSLKLGPATPPVSATTSGLTILEKSLGSASAWFDQFAGAFGLGGPNAIPPLVGIVMLAFAISAVFLVGVVTAKRRRVVVLGLFLLVACLLPVLIESSQVRYDGFDWFGRVSFPLYSGVIVMAAAIAEIPALPPPAHRSPIEGAQQRFIVIVACLVGGSQFLDVLWAIRRYAVGLSGPLNIFAHVRGGFTPPVPIALLVVAALVFCGAFTWLIISAAMASPSTHEGALTMMNRTDDVMQGTGSEARASGKT